MQDYSVAIKGLIAGHEQALARLRAYDEGITRLTSLRQSWIPGRPVGLEQELDKLEEALDSIRTDIEEHIRVEEQEILPILTEYAASIISRGVLHEHKKILKSISGLRKHAGDWIKKPADRKELLNREFKVREAINGILQLIQEHSNAQEVIFNLAHEALAEESENSGPT